MRATKIVESVKGMPYEERLRKLKLPTMTYRRARGLMMEVWKHINSYDTAVISPTFQFTRSARYPLQLKRFNSKGSQSKSFYHLAPALWNDLPLAVRETECRNTFKNRLDKHWRGHPIPDSTTTSDLCRIPLAEHRQGCTLFTTFIQPRTIVVYGCAISWC